MSEFLTKRKIYAEDLVAITILVILVVIALIYRKLIYISLIVYPSFALFVYGSFKLRDLFRNPEMESVEKILKIIFWIIGILFTFIVMVFVFISPTMTLENISVLITLPILCVGLAAVFKGILVNSYSNVLRAQNIIVGIITVGYSTFALLNPVSFFILHIIVYPFLLGVNLVLRASLYLSEFNLSLWNRGSYKVFYYVISGNYLELSRLYPEE